uniref:TNFR-Cys domain-containing protein n=1 Tax=Ficedula albicollis TaxID=59894 RepID=U3K5K9_FICAL
QAGPCSACQHAHAHGSYAPFSVTTLCSLCPLLPALRARQRNRAAAGDWLRGAAGGGARPGDWLRGAAGAGSGPGIGCWAAGGGAAPFPCRPVRLPRPGGIPHAHGQSAALSEPLRVPVVPLWLRHLRAALRLSPLTSRGFRAALTGTYVASTDCGRAAGADCQPCPDGTFSIAAGRGGCRMCRQCEGVFRYLKDCSSTSDAECTCKEGYSCGDDGCTFCTRSCGVGKESTRNGCQTCRNGTFNDQPNGSCKNWTMCSGNQVLEPGTPEKDVVCRHASVNPTLVTTLPTTSLEIPFSITVPGKDVQTDMIRISVTVAGLSCIIFLLPLCICFSVWHKKKLHTVFKKSKINMLFSFSF